jgi:hypothetical protein
MCVFFQVSNWFINARVRLWKPMVEEMYQQETKEEDTTERGLAQTPTPTASAATPASTTGPAATTIATTTPTGKRSDVNASESDPSLIAINRQCFSENQAKQANSTTTTSEVAPPASQCFPAAHDSSDMHQHRSMAAEDTCRRGSVVAADFGTISGNADIGSTLIRFGTTAGDVSLTLGLRHAGNMPEKSSSFSVRDFGGC